MLFFTTAISNTFNKGLSLPYSIVYSNKYTLKCNIRVQHKQISLVLIKNEPSLVQSITSARKNFDGELIVRTELKSVDTLEQW